MPPIIICLPQQLINKEIFSKFKKKKYICNIIKKTIVDIKTLEYE